MYTKPVAEVAAEYNHKGITDSECNQVFILDDGQFFESSLIQYRNEFPNYVRSWIWNPEDPAQYPFWLPIHSHIGCSLWDLRKQRA
jgi:hypothetical protein